MTDLYSVLSGGVFSKQPQTGPSYQNGYAITPSELPYVGGVPQDQNSAINQPTQAPINTNKAVTTSTPTNQPAAPQPYSYNGMQFPSYDAFTSAVNNAYGDAYNSLNDVRNNINNSKDTYLNAATTPFDQLRPDVDQAYNEGVNLNSSQVNKVNQQQQSALSDARNLYNELIQGQQQRFGGSSSAGDFAQAYLGRGLQKQVGGVAGTTQQNLTDLGTQLSNVTSQHQTNLQKIEAEKANALSQAQKDFQSRLDAIDQAKVGLDQNKAQMKLSELQNLRNTSTQIQAQYNQALLNAGVAHSSSIDALRNSIAGFQAYAGRPIDLSAIPGLSNPLAGSNVQIPQVQGGYQGQVAQGNLKYDPLTGQYVQA